MKKVNLFNADKAMSVRVADFMSKKVWGITLKARCKAEIETLENAIKGYEKLEGSILGEEAPRLIEEAKAEIMRLNEVLSKQLKEEATFDFTEEDKTFYKAYKNDATIEGLRAWFKVYKLEVADTQLEANILDAIRGKRRANARTIVRSNATQFNDAIRTKNDVLGLFYGELAEEMLRVGTLKPSAIPSDVREFYEPKKKTVKVENLTFEKKADTVDPIKYQNAENK